MKNFRGNRWRYTTMKEINKCRIFKVDDKATGETWYEVQDGTYMIAPTIGKFTNVKDARECARKANNRGDWA